MQETKVEDAKFPQDEFAQAGYFVSFRGNKQYNGVAVASKQKAQKIRLGLDGDPTDPDRLLAWEFGNFAVLNVYVPQGQDVERPQFAYKLEWFKRLKKYLQKYYKPQDHVVLCGDFNVAPENIDVHNPKRILGHVSFNPEVWKAYEDMKSWGFTDVFRHHHPGEAGQYTFFDYRVRDSVERNMGWRVDHILATRSVAVKSLGCTIDMATRLADKPSDHAVIYAEWKGDGI